MKKLTSSEKILIEDALKHLYDCEYKAVSCTVHSIAGALFITGDHSASLLNRLEALGLVSIAAGTVTLTPDGRSYALRVVRIHRLWERYLADQTGEPESAWHSSAEIMEHKLTPSDADALSASMGNPLFDPHGDPIPTSGGELPERDWRPLISLESGQVMRIVHIEDEPPAVFAQLSALGLYPGMHIRMIRKEPARVCFEANGDEVILAPSFADHISVAPLPAEEYPLSSYVTLDTLAPGESAKVIGISKACRGTQRRRLMDFGIVPGSVITSELKSVWGDPTAYKIRGTLIALRRLHSKMIFIEKKEKTDA